MRKFDGLYFLDDIDRTILKELTGNARATMQGMAEKIGTSRVTVFRRMDAMEKAGVIMGYTVLVDWKKLGNS